MLIVNFAGIGDGLVYPKCVGGLGLHPQGKQ
jgi:hypothetical protein